MNKLRKPKVRFTTYLNRATKQLDNAAQNFDQIAQPHDYTWHISNVIGSIRRNMKYGTGYRPQLIAALRGFADYLQMLEDKGI